MSIRVQGIRKRYGGFQALDGIDLEVAQGELVALLGPSGSGKTTLLRIVAGLERPDAGSVAFAGRDATGVSPRDRGVGFVFQHYALFRHMSVFENVAFGLRVKPRGRRPSRADIRRRVQDLLRLVQLEGFADRSPAQLSGGQRQRVALARALVTEPAVLLLDEPFGALDAKVRRELRAWLRRLHRDLDVTSVFVTHDQEEALEVADRVVIMHQGRIRQVGTPLEVYERPADPFVFDFLGSVTRLPGVGAVRPHELEVSRGGAPGAVRTVLEHVVPVGPSVRLLLRHAGAQGGAEGEVEVEVPRERYLALGPRAGDELFVAPRAAPRPGPS